MASDFLFFLLAAAAVLAIPVAVLYLLAAVQRLKRDLRGLEETVAQLRRAPPPQAMDTDTATDMTPDTPAPKPRPQAEAAPDLGPWKIRKSDLQTPQAPESPQPPQSTPPPPPPPPPEREPREPHRAVVMRADNLQRLGAWVSANWIYVVSAMSLALAGIFLVQYGAENDLLPPRLRVLAALGFGAALIGAGEWIRRRFGDGAEATTAYLPSVFSGAGLVTLFGGVLAARMLYDLIGAEVALGGLVASALVGLILGWFHGPLLAAISIIGAMGAPFVVGGSSDDPSWLYGYFAVIAGLGLGIDTVRRWAWITVLSLALAFGASALVMLSDPGTAPGFVAAMAVLAILGTLIPVRRATPDHGGAMVVETLARVAHGNWPEFPTRVAFGAIAAASAGLVWASFGTAVAFWCAACALVALGVLLTLWSRKAEALQDAALIPAVGFVGALVWQGTERGPVWQAFRALPPEGVEPSMPMQATILLALGAALSLASLWRALGSKGAGARFALIWAGGAALFAPATAIALEAVWQPARAIGTYPWALHAAALAALMVLAAERLARTDGAQDRLRMSLPVLSALSALSFAFAIMFAQTALTLAVVSTVIAAAALDARFRMPLMGAFITVGVTAIGYRLIADPGLEFANRGPLWEIVATYGGALLGFLAALRLLAGLDRPSAKTVLDSAAWSTGGLFLSVLLMRWLDRVLAGQDTGHWAMGLFAVIWLGLMAAQLQRVPLGGVLRYVRAALATIFAILGFGALALGLTLMNPLLGGWFGKVSGPPVINTLAVAYLLPALLLLATVWRVTRLHRATRAYFLVVGIGLVAFWAFAAIRHFWQGADGMELSRGVTQPELYSYTVALLLVGAGLFYQSLAKRSKPMRTAGLCVIGLAVAKVFFVDVSGLTGLTRVFSFLLLGLALAGLALLGRWAESRATPGTPDPDLDPDRDA